MGRDSARECSVDRYRHIRFFRPRRVAVRSPVPGPCSRGGAGVASPGHPPALEPEEREFFDWLLGLERIERADYREAPLQRRRAALLRALGCRDLPEARRKLQQHPPAVPRALDALLIGATGFFRDPEVFACLEDRVLPELVARRGGLRVWSAGCASGAELYSLAILLARAGVLDRSLLVGTDCRATPLAQAARAWYGEAEVSRVAPPWRDGFFGREGSGWTAVPALRGAAQWRRADAVRDDPPLGGGFDVVLCRNVMIYLELPAVERLLARLTAALHPGGVLVLGKAERPDALRRLTRLGPCLWRTRESSDATS